ncbi:MAG: amino acid adenylation domain-containing protein [Bacteroidota bacterium]
MSTSDKSSSKHAKLAQWLARAKEKRKQNAILPLETGASAPLSYGQQRLWLLQHLFSANPFYNYADMLILEGELDMDRLQQAFQQIVRRHRIFRIGFQTEDGKMIQRHMSEEFPFIEVHDLSNLPEEVSAQQTQKIAIEAARQPFDLSSGRLTKLLVIHQHAEAHVLVLIMHHIITDNASFEIFVKELGIFYRAKPAEIDTLPDAKIQYPDFAQWQQQGPVPSKQLSYWKQKLSGDLAILDLPTDRPRPTIRSFRGEYVSVPIPNKLQHALKALAQQLNTTLFVLLLSAFKVLLYRYAHQRDILVGVPISNRDQVALESMIGFFNETQVLRSGVDPTQSFEGFVQQVKTTVLEAFDHKQLPFELLVKELNPERELSHNPLFQVMFLYKEAPKAGQLDDSLSYRHATLDIGVSKFDLTLAIMEEHNQLSSIIEYATDLFDAATIERMQQNFLCLLTDAVAHPQKSIQQLDILSESDRISLLDRWNPPIQPLSEANHIHVLIEQQAHLRPQAIALKWEGGSMSYESMNQQAQLIANHLIQQTDSSYELIGICGEAGPEIILGILGILKAGKAYLPLDPDYPANRIQWMLEDAGVSLVLTGQGSRDLSLSKIKTVEIAALVSGPKQPPLFPNQSSSLAYVIYTSGSSGRPKGVPISHSNLLHSTRARSTYYRNTPAAFLLLSSFSFDSSVAGIYWTLCGGGTLVLTKRRIEQDIARLSSLIQQQQISHTLLLPSLYGMLLRHADPTELASLKTVIVAGESCSNQVIKDHFAILPEVLLYNEYGPTEATVWATVHQIQEEDARTRVPIGQPIPRMHVYLLDDSLQAVPIGASGELFIGGEGIASGYLHRPQLSENRFLKHPIHPTSPYVLYRTGDMARFRSDGVLEFLGRKDEQIKLRGYRIELNEIEEVLRRQPGIQEVAVLMSEPENTSESLDVDSLTLATALLELGDEVSHHLLDSIESLSEKEVQLLLKNIHS